MKILNYAIVKSKNPPKSSFLRVFLNIKFVYYETILCTRIFLVIMHVLLNLINVKQLLSHRLLADYKGLFLLYSGMIFKSYRKISNFHFFLLHFHHYSKKYRSNKKLVISQKKKSSLFLAAMSL